MPAKEGPATTPFAKRLREAMETAKIDIATLAERSGISESQIYRYRSGENDPSYTAGDEIAYILKCDSHWLASGKKPKT